MVGSEVSNQRPSMGGGAIKWFQISGQNHWKDTWTKQFINIVGGRIWDSIECFALWSTDNMI